MQLSDRLRLVALVMVVIFVLAISFCDLGTRRKDFPTCTPPPAPTPWWPTPDYQPWTTVTPEGG